MKRLKKAFMLFGCAVLLCGFANRSSAQRAIGAHQLILDDGTGHTLTISPSTMVTNQTFTFPATTSYTPGSVLFGDALGAISQNNAKLFWDNTLFRLGIGTTTPGFPLDVTGAAQITGALTLGTALGVTSGGTGSAAAPTQGGAIYGASASAYASTAAGSSGQVLTSNGSSAPTWQTGLPVGAVVLFADNGAHTGFSILNGIAVGSDNWSTGTSLPSGQGEMVSGVVNGKIYVIGGGDGSQNNNQIYDPSTDTWTTGAALPVAQFAMTSAVVNGKIYVIGGWNGSHNNNQIYDPVANTWSTGAVLPVGQDLMTSAVISGKIYVIGGNLGSQNNNQIYDPVANTWSTGAVLPVGQVSMTSQVVGGKIYVIGGDLGSHNSNQIYTPGPNLYYFTKN